MKQQFTIDMNQPGSILQDFHTLLDFIGADGELVSKKLLVFSTKTLLVLNQRITISLAQDKKRPQHTTFPHIAVLYKCAHLLSFFHYTDEKSRKRIHINSSAISSWNALNITEKYFTLLEVWLYGDPEDYRSFLPPAQRLNWFQSNCLNRTKDEYQKIFKNEYKIGELLAGLELFGLITINHAKPDVGGGWKINTLKQTSIGKFIINTLEENENKNADNIVSMIEMLISRKPDNYLLDIFQPYFQEYKKTYFVKPNVTNQTGTYVFKVSLLGAWRRIAVVHEATLEELSAVILSTFDFDNDHLHSFEFLDTTGKKREYFHPACIDTNDFTDAITLAELPLSIKNSMKYIFDFGDWWEFNVQLEEIDRFYKIEDSYGAEIIAGEGEAPEQYPVWGEDE